MFEHNTVGEKPAYENYGRIREDTVSEKGSTISKAKQCYYSMLSEIK